MIRSLISPILALAVALGNPAWASVQSASSLPGKPEISVSRLEKLEHLTNQFIDQGHLAGSVILVSHRGEIIYWKAQGYADTSTARPLQRDSIFRIYSMTKPVVTAALMILYEDGRFQLNDPVSKYLPEFKNLRVLRTPDSDLSDTVPAEREPTIQDLLRHTAGFSHGPTDVNPTPLQAAYVSEGFFDLDVPLSETTRRLAKLPLESQPRTKWEYSLSTDIVARLIEVLSKQTLNEFLDSRIFGPLRMTDTGYFVPQDKASRLASMHWKKNGSLVPASDASGYPAVHHPVIDRSHINGYTFNPIHKAGSVGLVSTTQDYWRLMQMLLNGGSLDGVRILSPNTIEYMFADHLAPIGLSMGPPNSFWAGRSFSLGFGRINSPPAAGIASSPGTLFWSGAGGTTFWIDPAKELSVVIMTPTLTLGTPKWLEYVSSVQVLIYSSIE